MAAAVFSLLMLTLAMLEMASRRAADKESAHTDTYRMAMLAIAHLTREFRGAKLVPPMPVDKITYKVPRLDAQGMVVDNGAGAPEWDPPDPDQVSIYLDSNSHCLMRALAGEPPRILGYLGNSGAFEWKYPQPGQIDLIEVKIVAKEVNVDNPLKSSEYTASTKFYFPNQP